MVALGFTAFAQTAENRPKLVVGVVVDQMRYDFLYRYSEKYGDTGFKRLLKNGYSCENTHIPYVPTFTAPGHTCIYTGSVPAIHGIVGNDWYSRQTKHFQYCTTDTSFVTVGAKGKTGQQSPNQLKATTITDELRLATNFKSKTIGIALKDRSSILPAGHAANHAYWYDGKSGNFVSSSYYGDTLPAWVNAFNARGLAASYLKSNWNVLQKNGYAESTEDDVNWESNYTNEEHPVFPHRVDELTKNGYAILPATPWGNSITFEMAKAAIKNENLGRNGTTDFLAVSFSSTDYIGHQFGPNSVETEDGYLRFDKELGEFLIYLDQTVGAGNYLLFLSADHGVSHAVGFNKKHNIPAGNVKDHDLDSICNKYLYEQYGEKNMVEALVNFQVYLNQAVLEKHDIREKDVVSDLSAFLMKQPNVKAVVDLHHLSATTLEPQLKERLTNGYNHQLSGDLQIIYEPAVLEAFETGTTHGSNYNYDTHIPLVWFGWNVKAGKDFSEVRMTDIAATLAAMLHIQEPSGCVGKPIQGLLK